MSELKLNYRGISVPMWLNPTIHPEDFDVKIFNAWLAGVEGVFQAAQVLKEKTEAEQPYEYFKADTGLVWRYTKTGESNREGEVRGENNLWEESFTRRDVWTRLEAGGHLEARGYQKLQYEDLPNWAK